MQTDVLTGNTSPNERLVSFLALLSECVVQKRVQVDVGVSQVQRARPLGHRNSIIAGQHHRRVGDLGAHTQHPRC